MTRSYEICLNVEETSLQCRRIMNCTVVLRSVFNVWLYLYWKNQINNCVMREQQALRTNRGFQASGAPLGKGVCGAGPLSS